MAAVGSTATCARIRYMATHETIAITLSQAVLRKVNQVRKRERCTASDVVNEALERFFSIRAVRASKADLAAMRRARAEIKAGKFVTLDEALHGMISRKS